MPDSHPTTAAGRIPSTAHGLLLIESLPHAVATLGPDGRVAAWNNAAESLFGISRQEMIGREPGSLLPAMEAAEAARSVKAALEGHDTVSFETSRSGGATDASALTFVFAPIKDSTGAILGASMVVLDISDRRQVEDKLRAAERLNSTAFEYAPIGIVLRALDGRILKVNRALCDMLGYSSDELLQLPFRQISHPEDIAKDEELMRKARDGEGHGYQVEKRYARKDGSIFWGLLSLSLLHDGEGAPVHFICHVQDITEHKRTSGRLRRLTDSNAQGVYFWKHSGEITSANDAFLRMIGYSREELEAGAIDWREITPEESTAADEEAMRQLETEGTCKPFEKEYIHKDGKFVPVLLGAAIFEDTPDEGVAFALDLTERKKLENQFLRAQRMESIGTLAGGIAHDLNNALAPVLMSIDLLQGYCDDPFSKDILSTIELSSRHAANLVRQVLSFARGVEGQRMEVQVRHLVGEIKKLAMETFLKHITIETAVPRDLWTVMGDSTQLHQVLMNLCVNARDAMPDGGHLKISAENLPLDTQYAALNPEARPGPYVVLEVEDSGTGMPPDMLDKIFDPFFTTKPVGKGTGLGLSTCMAIVKSHGGFVRVYSELGRGTTFKIYLPAVTDVSPEEKAAAQINMPRGKGELILVVDDEASVRQITQQTLIAFGYRAVVAADGADAVAIYAKEGEGIAAVLTDMMMPVMDGPAAIQVLHRMNPQVTIIGASGLSANSHVMQASRLGVKYFLPKPYTASALLQTLREAIDNAPSKPAAK